jgi:opacity protein-like surface antigen
MEITMKSIARTKSFRKLAAAAVFVSISLAGSAYAQQSPFYIGVAGGTTHYDFNFAQQATILSNSFQPLVRATLDDTDKGYKLTLGYQVVPQFAVELDYVDLGKAKTSYELNGFGRFTREGTYKISGVNLAGVFSQPIGERFSILGRLGVLYSKYQYSETGLNFPAFDPSPVPPIHSFTALDLKRSNLSYGVGLDYKLNPATALRLGWDRYTDIGNRMGLTETENGRFDNIDLYSLGVMFRF